jgi:7-keto-8-aminopelargonate synthetase-like enzyme
VKEASIEAVKRFSCGLSSSRVQATTTAHVELEERLAAWYGYESCLLFTTGYQAMVGTIAALADQDTTLVLDNLSHACILDGTFMAAGTPRIAPEVRFFNHNSARSLRRILSSRERKNAMVLLEGIYSLDGDEATIQELCKAAGEFENTVIVCDDAHGTGTLGKGGRGIFEKYDLRPQLPVIVSTFSKTFGGIGGILLGPKDVVDHVKHNARSFLFSASLPVPIVAAAATILDMLEDHGEELVSELHTKADYMRKNLTGLGLRPGAEQHAHHAGHVPRRAQGAVHARGHDGERRDDGAHHLPGREEGRGAPAPERDARPHLRGHGQGPRALEDLRRGLLHPGRRRARAHGGVSGVECRACDLAPTAAPRLA